MADSARRSRDYVDSMAALDEKGPFAVGRAVVFRGRRLEWSAVATLSISPLTWIWPTGAVAIFVMFWLFIETESHLFNLILEELSGANALLFVFAIVPPWGLRRLVLRLRNGEKHAAFVRGYTARTMGSVWSDSTRLFPDVGERPSR